MCEACRSVSSVRPTSMLTVRVARGTPSSLRYPDPASRVPIVWPVSVTWCLRAETLLVEMRKKTWGKLKALCLQPTTHFTKMECVIWPESLERLTLTHGFKYDAETVVFPRSLTELRFASKRLDLYKFKWPSTIRKIVLDKAKNISTYCRNENGKLIWHDGLVDLPHTLQEIEFGDEYECTLPPCNWPSGLRIVRCGRSFNEYICHIKWPDGIQIMEFGSKFNKPVARVAWPVCLQELRFGTSFNRSIADVDWRRLSSLRKLEFGSGFKQSISGIQWPSTLKSIRIGKKVYDV